MTEWQEVKLGEICDVRDGTHDSPKQALEGKYLVTSKHIKGGRIDLSSAYKISLEDFDFINQRSEVDQWDILISMIGTVGEVCLISNQPDFAIKNVGLIKTGNKDLARYLFYYLKSPVAQNGIESRLKGTTQQYLALSEIRDFPISLPPLEIQRKIAGILGALDDKIEVLRAQNKTLEQMAQAVFQSWFVDFDIVRAKAAGLPAADVCKKYHITPDIYDLFPSAFSADNLPLGWEKKKLSDLLTNVKVTIKPSKETISKPYVPIDCISSECLTLYDSKSGNEAQSSLISFRKKDILFGAMRVYFHKVCIAPYEGTTRSTVFVLRPQNKYDLSFSLLSIFQKNCIEFANMNSKGTTMPYAVWENGLSDYQTEASSPETREAFNNLIEPYLDRLIENSKQIRTLEQTRDTLLPQLFGGKLDVENVAVSSVIGEV